MANLPKTLHRIADINYKMKSVIYKMIFLQKLSSKMRQLHNLKISKINRLTSDAIEIFFLIPENLKSEFEFIAGQYITICEKINNEEVRRAYSLCSNPDSSEVAVGVKKVEGGKMSTFLIDTLKEGDVIGVMKPKGRFILGDQNKVVGICAGSGITPVLSIMKKMNNKLNFTLVYGNKTENSSMFLDEIKQMNINTHFAYSRQEVQGCYNSRIDRDLLLELSEEKSFLEAEAFFICGPGEMIDMAEEFLLEKGVEKSKLHFERFTAKKKKKVKKPADEGAEIISNITVILDGEDFAFTLSDKGKTILDAAMEQGADVPFSCKGGVCCTCRAKVMEGKAIMNQNFSLSEDEVEEGFILTCQAHPITENIVVDFDEM